MNILITSAGRRVSLVKAFQKELINFFADGKVYTADLVPDLSPACMASDGYFSIVKVTDPTYCQKLVDICLANKIQLVVPTIDTELIPISENVELFLNNGIHPLISSIEIVRICRDKRKLFQYFDSLGFPRTIEINFEHPEFPVFVKPIDGSSSIGSKVIIDNSQLPTHARFDNSMVYLKYLSPLEWSEYSIDMYFDKECYLKCAVPRERLEVRAGEVSKSVTRRDALYDRICKVFKHCNGFKGCITLQVFKNHVSDEIIGIEINPRFGGGYPLSYHAGANYPEFIIREYILNEPIQFYDRWAQNMLMLRYDDEIIVNDFKSR